MTDAEICRVPVSARIVVRDGQAEVVSAEWREVEADALARWLLAAAGISEAEVG